MVKHKITQIFCEWLSYLTTKLRLTVAQIVTRQYLRKDFVFYFLFFPQKQVHFWSFHAL